MTKNDFTITLNIDSVKYNAKPSGGEIANISNRLGNPKSIKTVTPQQLIEAIREGRTFTPAKLKGNGKRNAEAWDGQQVICADIDNDKELLDENGNKVKDENGKVVKVRLENPLTLELALYAMHKYDILPYFVYNSFRYKKDWEKFRIVLILDEPITDADEAADLTARFTAIFNAAVDYCADTQTSDVARMFLGTNNGDIYQPQQITPLEKLRQLPQVIKPTPPEKVKREYTPTTRSNFDDINRRFNYDKEHFNLVEYIEATEGTAAKTTGNSYDFTPCPICGHSGDFKIEKGKEHLWTCFSDSTPPGTGGTIIDYLILKHDWDIKTAIDFFKYDIMKYERPTERQAERTASQSEAKAEAVTAQTATDYLSNDIFTKDIEYFKQYKDRKTGFKELDKHLTLYPGLAALGGASSLGKTTFATNLIDNLLNNGETVLYFSLEQLPIEIITKHLTRALYEKHPNTKLTNIDIKNGGTCPELEAVKRETAERLKNYHIITGDFHITAANIVKYVETFINDKKVKPVVIIDYLQLIAPPDGFRGDTRAATDENIKILKDFQKRNELFVIFISSFNRSSNGEPVSYEAFKETSMIEYTCDFIWGLQLQIQGERNFYVKRGKQGGESARPDWEKQEMIDEALREPTRKVQFVSLKNRNGKRFFKANFKYYPQFDCFIEDGTDALPFGAGDFEETDDGIDWGTATQI